MSESPFQRRSPRQIERPRPAPEVTPAPAAARGPARQRGGPPGVGGGRGGAGGGGPKREGGGGTRMPLALLLAAAVVGVILAVLFLPPFSLLGGDDEAASPGPTAEEATAAGLGIEAQVQEQLPPLPDNLRPVSPVYALRMPVDVAAPVSLTVRLTGQTQDQRNLGAYTYAEGLWRRVGPALLTNDGRTATVELESVPGNLAILRRAQFRDTVTGRLPAGAELDPEAVNTLTILNPVGFVPGEDASLLGRVEPFPPEVTQPVYPVVTAGPAEADIANTVIASPQLRRQHLNNIQLMVQTGRYDGVEIDYPTISPALRDAFTEFITQLGEELHRDGRGLSVVAPLPSRDASGLNEGAYDLKALAAAADLLKVTPPADFSIYADAVQAALPFVIDRVPAEKVLLVISPLSVQRTAGEITLLSQREALGVASRLSVREAGPVAAGGRVTLVGESLFQDAGASGLRWDAAANAVSFVFTGSTGEPVTIWIQNRFSVAFQLAVLAPFKLGGIALADVSADPGHANLWDTVGTFLESGDVPLVRPSSQILDPVWEVSGGAVSGAGSAGWVVWSTPTRTGVYEARLIVSDGDVRVGHVIEVTVEP